MGNGDVVTNRFACRTVDLSTNDLSTNDLSSDLSTDYVGDATGACGVPEQAQPDSSESAAPSSALLSSADEMVQAVVGLLAELAASLEGSQKAVLASNGPGIENCVREQVRLHRALELLLGPRAWPGTAVENVREDGNLALPTRPAVKLSPPLPKHE